jgi:four helix bundle protein
MARDPQDLQCWRLADRLRGEVHAICARKEVAGHRRFCDGFTEAAGSVCRNISEGFGRYGSGAIVQYFTYALGSLQEVKDYLLECRTRQFIDEPRLADNLELLEHTKATALNFMKYHERKRRPPGRRKRRIDPPPT